MNIENKYNSGDMVWVIDSNRRVVEKKIICVTVTQKLNEKKMSLNRTSPLEPTILIQYEFETLFGFENFILPEKEVFTTKEELINSL